MLIAASNSVTEARDAADWGGYQYDVSALFGAAPAQHSSYDKDGTITGVPVDLFNRKLQVPVFGTATGCVCHTQCGGGGGGAG